MKKQKKAEQEPVGYCPRIVVKFRDYVDLPYVDGAEKYFEECNIAGRHDLARKGRKDLTFKRMFTVAEVEKIKALIDLASERDKNYVPGNLLSYFIVECPEERNPKRLEKFFGSWPSVEKAYFDPPGSEPIVTPDTNPRFANQGYLDPAPDGIDAEFAWPRPGGIGFTGGDGAGISVIDLERGWTFNHEDLNALGITLLHGGIRDGSRAHGTSVFGEICSADNGLGCVGIAPGVASARAVSYWTSTRPNALLAAILNLGFGDVLLLEAQLSIPGWSNMPIEVLDAEFEVIRLATALGIIVVEAAGNGSNDLDTYLDGGGNAILSRSAGFGGGFRDSGAIMVGAGSSTTPHTRMGFSNFGSRIDNYAWGENVNTTSSNSSGSTTAYTSTFNGTSSASPIITGAALILQGIAEDNLGYRFSPFQMRNILRNPSTGTPSNNPPADRIGVMPDLRAILTNDIFNLAPDVYIRDNVGDTGDPHTGSISASPDIILRPDIVADPVAAFGEGSGTENTNTLGHEVEAGQNNFIYTRLKNRGGSNALGVSTAIYWSPVSTLVTPDLWTFIGNTSTPNVPAGDTLAVSGPLTWPEADIPGEGHYCLVGIVNHVQDPAPGPAEFLNWDNFRAFIRENNNVTWRNFNVVDNEPSFNSPFEFVQLPFLAPGAFDRTRRMSLEVVGKLPRGSRMVLEMPLSWADAINLPQHKLKMMAKVKKGRDSFFAPINPCGKNVFANLALPAKSRSKLTLWVQIPKEHRKSSFEVYARQLYKNEEVGRVTWRLQPKADQKPKKPIRRKKS